MHWCVYLHATKSKYYSKESAIHLHFLLLKELVLTVKCWLRDKYNKILDPPFCVPALLPARFWWNITSLLQDHHCLPLSLFIFFKALSQKVDCKCYIFFLFFPLPITLYTPLSESPIYHYRQTNINNLVYILI